MIWKTVNWEFWKIWPLPNPPSGDFWGYWREMANFRLKTAYFNVFNRILLLRKPLMWNSHIIVQKHDYLWYTLYNTCQNGDFGKKNYVNPPGGDFGICLIFQNSQLACMVQNYRLLKILKSAIFNIKSPFYAHKTAKIATWCIWHLSNFSKFPISVVQNHRLLKILKYAIFSLKSPFYAH